MSAATYSESIQMNVSSSAFVKTDKPGIEIKNTYTTEQFYIRRATPEDIGKAAAGMMTLYIETPDGGDYEEIPNPETQVFEESKTFFSQARITFAKA